MPDEISSIEANLFNDNCKLFVPTFECLPQTLHRVLTIARKRGVKTLVNGAPPFSTPPPKEMYPLFDVFCLNETEATITTGVDVKTIEDGKKSCRVLLERGCGSVILTMGDNGALYMDSSVDFHVPVQQKVTPVDTTVCNSY
ncbi:unnamed protein product [Medioppia subpectinata]|uniref:Carbohydrate kinase PfkB domain-containing protein n=1 Tax=Medioppia subpectinata TaxID=1979941 RepID=A0A7R9LBR0_9ACAR|nr:unnamed protein product [Medioppia subpectinata]CAG2116997.1 unnamed protein product [Medioppia subpectinata]